MNYHKFKLPLKVSFCELCEKEKACYPILGYGYVCVGCLGSWYSNCGGTAESQHRKLKDAK